MTSRPRACESLQAELGDAVGTFVGDVTVEADAEALVALAADRFGGLDAAFHVAGASRAALIVDLTEEDWDFTVDLCLKGVFFGIKHAARRMIEQGRGGAIVNIASLNSRVPMFFGAAYSAAKAGVVSLGQSAALELGEHGIRVSTVSPGLTATPLVRPMTDVPAVQAAYMERIPLGRAATPEDIAASATFLASDDAAYVSGANLFVDGGWEQTGYPDLRPMFADILASMEATPSAELTGEFQDPAKNDAMTATAPEVLRRMAATMRRADRSRRRRAVRHAPRRSWRRWSWPSSPAQLAAGRRRRRRRRPASVTTSSPSWPPRLPSPPTALGRGARRAARRRVGPGLEPARAGRVRRP